jgi:hypothetical protein
MKLENLPTAEKKILQTRAIKYHGFTTSLTSNPVRQQTERIFYAASGMFLFILMLIGFQQFYLHGNAFPNHPIFPGLKVLIIAHGIAMTCWMILFVSQTLLVVSGNFRTHIFLGMLGIGLAVLVLLLGSWTAISTARMEPELVRGGLNRRQFLIVPLTDMLKFGILVTIAFLNRRRPEIHRPMMLLATLTTISAVTGRIPAVHNVYAFTIWEHLFGPFFPKLVFGAAFLIIKTALTRRLDLWFTIGFTAVVAISFFTLQIAPSAAWQAVSNFLTKVT